MGTQQSKSPSLVTDLQINLRICQHAFKLLPDTVSDKNSWDTLIKRSPRPSQSCLSRFGRQILYTNNEGTRRPQSVPTILTETVALLTVSGELGDQQRPALERNDMKLGPFN